jgi:hypothetical protein
MKSRMKLRSFALIYTTIAIIIAVVAINIVSMHRGKDGGMIFMIVSTSLSLGLLWLFHMRKFRYLIMGIFLSVASYFLTWVLYGITSLVIIGEMTGWNVSYIVDQVISIAISIAVIYFFEARFNQTSINDSSTANL